MANPKTMINLQQSVDLLDQIETDFQEIEKRYNELNGPSLSQFTNTPKRIAEAKTEIRMAKSNLENSAEYIRGLIGKIR